MKRPSVEVHCVLDPNGRESGGGHLIIGIPSIGQNLIIKSNASVSPTTTTTTTTATAANTVRLKTAAAQRVSDADNRSFRTKFPQYIVTAWLLPLIIIIIIITTSDFRVSLITDKGGWKTFADPSDPETK